MCPIPLSVFLSTLAPPDATLRSVIDAIVDLERRGLDGVWASDGLGYDSMTTLALAGTETSRISLGTAIAQTWPRHPVVMARHAQITNIASNGRFRLGIGPGHRSMMAKQYGIELDRPISHMREYVTITRTLLRDGAINFNGARYQAHATLRREGLGGPVLMSALSEQMCRLAGEISDGLVVWLAPPAYVEATVVPMVREGAERAGRTPPPIVVGAPATASTDQVAVRDAVRTSFAVYPTLPFYVAVFQKSDLLGADRALTDGWSDAMVDAVIPSGGQRALATRIEEYQKAGADEVVLAPFGAGSTTVIDTLDTLEAINRRAPQ